MLFWKGDGRRLDVDEIIEELRFGFARRLDLGKGEETGQWGRFKVRRDK